jgi:hypothetical protein
MAGTVGQRLRRIAMLGVVLHTLFLAAAPFEHHDLICHLKTPQHCTSCTSSPVASSSHAHASVGASQLADAGDAITVHAVSESTLLTSSTTGRSPPHSA